MTTTGARVGIDLVEVERFRRVLERTPTVTRRLFHPDELARLAGRRDPVPGLAARFAAKEAVMKALGCGLGAVALTDIEVQGGAGVPPTLALHGSAARRSSESGVGGWSVSLSHTAGTAAAVVVAT